MGTGGLNKRHVLVLMCFAAAFVCYIDRVNISIAIIPMAEHFGWSQTEKGFVLSSFFIGYMLGQIPSGWLANRVGGRWTLGGALILWSTFTALTPVAALAGFSALILARIVMGMGEAATFPATYNLFSKWIPRAERSRSVAFTLSGIPIGTVLGLAVSGYLVAEFGWASVFYAFGVAGLVLAAVWYWVVRDSPASHPGVSEAERQVIAAAVDVSSETVRTPLPVGKLVRSTAFWALVINHFCSNWILYVLLSWLPSYFRDVQHFSIAKAGLAAAAPWLSMFAMANLSAWVADRFIRNGASVSLIRKIMQSIGLLGSSGFLLLTLQANTPTEAILLVCGALGALGLTWAGYAPNHLEIAPKHADILMGVTNTAGTLPGVIGVAVSGWLLDTTGSYVSVFVLAAGITSVGALVWILFQRSTPIYD
ncbi:MAG: transporter [Panacagrimonas sp.]|jgi:ACS family sodium-dependent inorganic phosphate cotransporter|nr:ACS family MFS transporter [Panacagrimonas sp.]MCC2655607.1 transporter [Panacagrimonas sp.]